MSGRIARTRRITCAGVIGAAATIGAVAAASPHSGATASPTTSVAATAAPTTARPATPSTIPATTPATSAAPTTSPTTFPGPAPRGSNRVASPVDIEKIRATSVPFRQLGIAVAAAVALLAIAGFVYGKVRSRIPPVKIPRPATAGPAPNVPPAPVAPPAATPLPPPAPIPLPPPVVEDAVADMVIFEPPPTHHAPDVIAEAEEVVDVSDADATASPDTADPDTISPEPSADADAPDEPEAAGAAPDEDPPERDRDNG